MSKFTRVWAVVGMIAMAAGAGAQGSRMYARAVLRCQAADGAITMGAGSDRVIPYFGNIAAIGLADHGDLQGAIRWADWYQSHMQPDGTVDDHTGRAGAWVASGKRDSTDSYAATWLTLAGRLAARSDAYRRRLALADVKRAVAAIRLTMQPNGLTTAKPDYPVMYTMDNVEVAQGLRAAAALASLKGDRPASARWLAMARRAEGAIARELWDPSRKCYRVGIQTDGGRMEGLEKWYPDVMANLMAVGWLPPSARNRALFSRLWTRFGKDVPRTVRAEGDLDSLVWWAVAARGAGDSARYRTLAARMAAFDPSSISIENPALLGHTASLLALAPGKAPAVAGKRQTAPAGLIVPRDGLAITRSGKLKPGVYHLKTGLRIAANGVALDGSGATLVGDGAGAAVTVEGRSKVALRNLRLESYRWGILARKAEGLTIEGCRVRDTAEVPPDNTWLDIWIDAKDAYGSAILLIDCKGGAVRGNDVQHQQNGICMYNCSGVTVERNNASFESGWGIHMNSSSDNTIQDNLADWCNRIHKRGDRVYYPGADASGLLMIRNCNRNTIRRNMFRGGGDGVFVAGFHPDLGKVPCNDNLFEDNDGSYSPNNAFECTFCSGNIFRNNRANTSNYGFWLGYSVDTKVENNELRRNRVAGVAIEHGLRNTISGNRLFNNARGVALWSRSSAGFLEAFADQVASADNRITGNTFTANGSGLLIKREGEKPEASPRGDTVEGNQFVGNEVGALLSGAKSVTLNGNLFQANALAGLRSEDSTAVAATGNTFEDNGAWADAPVAWAGNFWNGGKPEGPAPGTEASPASTAPVPLAERVITQMDTLRSTPR